MGGGAAMPHPPAQTEKPGRALDQKNQAKRYSLDREIAVKKRLRKQRAKPGAERVPHDVFRVGSDDFSVLFRGYPDS